MFSYRSVTEREFGEQMESLTSCRMVKSISANASIGVSAILSSLEVMDEPTLPKNPRSETPL